MLPSLEKLLASNSYIEHLGLNYELRDDKIIAILPFHNDLIGNPMIPAIHGGVIAACMELVAIAQLLHGANLKNLPKTVNSSIDYLRYGKPQILYAKANIIKLGRRVANLEAIAWQEDENKPIAKLHGNFLLNEEK